MLKCLSSPFFSLQWSPWKYFYLLYFFSTPFYKFSSSLYCWANTVFLNTEEEQHRISFSVFGSVFLHAAACLLPQVDSADSQWINLALLSQCGASWITTHTQRTEMAPQRGGSDYKCTSCCPKRHLAWVKLICCGGAKQKEAKQNSRELAEQSEWQAKKKKKRFWG